MFKSLLFPRLMMFVLLAVLGAACIPVQSEGVAPTAVVGYLPTGELAPVEALSVEIGVGSPIPVQVVIDTSFPDPCAQLVGFQQNRAEGAFEFVVTTTPADADCASPVGPLPFRLTIPLNAAGLEPGTYSVIVNGATTTFSYPPAGAQ